MKARNLSGRDVIRILKEDGWIEVGVRGSHHYFKHQVKLGKISVPVHANKSLKSKTVRSISETRSTIDYSSPLSLGKKAAERNFSRNRNARYSCRRTSLEFRPVESVRATAVTARGPKLNARDKAPCAHPSISGLGDGFPVPSGSIKTPVSRSLAGGQDGSSCVSFRLNFLNFLNLAEHLTRRNSGLCEGGTSTGSYDFDRSFSRFQNYERRDPAKRDFVLLSFPKRK